MPRNRQRRGAGPALSPDQKRALRLWRAARVRLRRAGIEVADGATARELAGRMPDAAELVSAYSSARWGGAPLPVSEARALLRRFEERLGHRVAPVASP